MESRNLRSLRLAARLALFTLLGAGCAHDPASAPSGQDGGREADGGQWYEDTGTGDASPPALDAGIDAGGSDGGGIVDAGPALKGCPDASCDGTHRFTYRNANAQSVWVTGSFTGWANTPAGGAIEMTRESQDVWVVQVNLAPKTTHAYKFLVDGPDGWTSDPENPQTDAEGNAVVSVCTDTRICVESLCEPGHEGFQWEDSVLYFVMVDRFFDSDGSGPSGIGHREGPTSTDFEGGDLNGVRAKLSYLDDLGVSALWLSAPYKQRGRSSGARKDNGQLINSGGYHGYWPAPDNITYDASGRPSGTPSVDSRFGRNEDLKALIDEAHRTIGTHGHGMRVMLDYVMNHVDIESGLFGAHPHWFALDNGRPKTCIQGEPGDQDEPDLWNDPYWGTRCAFSGDLPPFDYAGSRDATHYSVMDAAYWAETYDLDGFRLDAIKHVPREWLSALRRELQQRASGPDGAPFYLLGETFDYDNRGLLKSYLDPDTGLDGQFDFPVRRWLCESLFRAEKSMQSLEHDLLENASYYGPDALMSTWIGNHDIPRAIHFADRWFGLGGDHGCRQLSDRNGWQSYFTQPSHPEPYERMALAFAVMLTQPGVPMIYYGDEIGLAGGGDPDNRRVMPWDDGALNPHQIALREKVSALAKARSAHPVLARGTTVESYTGEHTWVYRRSAGCDERSDVWVAINRADTVQTVQLPAGTYRDLVADEPVVVNGTLTLPARGFLLLEVTPTSP